MQLPSECRSGTGAWLRRTWARAWHACLGVLGAPDYSAYLIHHQTHHPERAPMSESEYVRCFFERRYGRGEGGRCC